jgi:hypothetical protein
LLLSVLAAELLQSHAVHVAWAEAFKELCGDADVALPA